MILSITGKIPLRVENLRPDTAIEGSKMSAATLIMEEVYTPCIIRNVVYGDMKKLETKPADNVTIVVFSRIRHTAHTRKGFVDVQITTKPVQFSVYIHAGLLQHFLGTCAMSIVRTGLNI